MMPLLHQTNASIDLKFEISRALILNQAKVSIAVRPRCSVDEEVQGPKKRNRQNK